MCGVVAVLRRRSGGSPPDAAELTTDLDSALAALAAGPAGLADAAAGLEALDGRLRGPAGVRVLAAHPDLAARLAAAMVEARSAIAGLEADLDARRLPLAGAELEAANAALVRLKDAVWAIATDRLRAAREVTVLAGGPEGDGAGAGDAALDGYWAIHVALSAIDRLEVRGRDSAGLHLLVTGHGIDPSDPGIAERSADPLFRSGSVRLVPDGAGSPGGGPALAFVYKAAAEIGELGDNVRAVRAAILDDGLLRRALASPEAEVTVVGHTRWASVGLISEANAHPLNSEEAGRPVQQPYVAAALNGDVDNHLELRAAEGLATPAEITTDAKVIPMLVSRRMAEGSPPAEAFRRTAASFEGSVAIAANAAADPGSLLLALRGSGQALYIGLADDAFVVASEPYGVVEETPRYLRMDGEATGGQIVVLRRAGAGTLAGLERLAYDGTPLPVADDEVTVAEITTRDVDRAGYPHFLLKEVSEAPESFRKTLRGKVVDGADGRLTVALGEDTLPAAVRKGLGAGAYRRVLVIGQGTAAVAGQILAATLTSVLPPAATVTVAALPASELSGFGLDDDMSDALVIAISQSGTTTDTNRTVDLVRARGAAVLAIVNRRNSDLVEKADGVLYTSDGRDVEMSVASTKAFYAQVAAGFLLSLAIARELGAGNARQEHELLAGLRELPAALEEVLAARPEIAAAASAHAPPRRHWAVVGNGPNRLAASELRIKLSELAYKSIACDATEDKKHIDLSSEPLILVCAAGLPPAAAADVGKELAIYRAHKAAPVVIATRGSAAAYQAALAVIEVPEVHPQLAFVLSAMAGHLFGYEAALAIDAQARGLREIRAAVEDVVVGSDGPPEHLLVRLAPRMVTGARTFLDGLRNGAYNGALEAGTAVQLASVLRYATRALPLELYELDHGRVGTPGAVVEDLAAALTRAIDELTRPVDAIRHQAKTVTVGISRSEEELFRAGLVAAALSAGMPRERFSYRVLRTLGALGPAVEEVTGFTRYRIEGDVGAAGDRAAGARIFVVDKGGVAAGLRSRAEGDGGDVLRGTKHRAATLQEVTVARGGTDGRTVVLVPEIRQGAVVGMTLLHGRFADRLPGPTMRAVLEGYQSRYGALVDAVTETAPFSDERLGELPVIDLLTSPVYVLAEAWRSFPGESPWPAGGTKRER
ncbi:MAG TPA: SIS domain-containing protein [Acidimicrobiia bacterium]|nr:SIS domain-containing protein [Acidimicrobiia bacterium]